MMNNMPLGNQTMAYLRNCLKSEMMEARGKLTALGWLPICPICDEPVEKPDMHEVLLTRGDVQGLKEHQKLRIFLPENCVLVHPGKCHLEAATREGARKCVVNLIEHEGIKAIQEWLGWFRGLLPDELLTSAFYMVAQADRENSG